MRLWKRILFFHLTYVQNMWQLHGHAMLFKSPWRTFSAHSRSLRLRIERQSKDRQKLLPRYIAASSVYEYSTSKSSSWLAFRHVVTRYGDSRVGRHWMTTSAKWFQRSITFYSTENDSNAKRVFTFGTAGHCFKRMTRNTNYGGWRQLSTSCFEPGPPCVRKQTRPHCAFANTLALLTDWRSY